MKTKKIYVFFLLLFWAGITGKAQIGDGSIPYSFSDNFKKNINTAKSSVKHLMLAQLDNESLLKEDALFHAENDYAYTFASPVAINKEIQDIMTWDTIENGFIMGRIRLSSLNAYSSFLIFDDFFLPEQTKLYAYSEDGNQVIGAFTHVNNKPYGRFSLGPIIGESIILEFVRPISLDSLPRLHLEAFIHAYKDVFEYSKNSSVQKNERSSDCFINVKCPEGNNWCNQIRSVAMIAVLSGSGLSGICTGSLINNERNDFRPYFLTANHCQVGRNVNDWIFIFNYQSNDCNNPFIYLTTTYSISGATLKANNCLSDFALLELSARPPAGYNVFYAGWDNKDERPESGATITHPNASVKKIAFYNNRPRKSAFPLSEISCDDHVQSFTVYWTAGNGSVDRVSSGGPLFNSEGHIVGQLSAKYGTTCTDNDYAFYGRLETSWNAGGSFSNRLKDWLNPHNGINNIYYLSMEGSNSCKTGYSFTNANDLHTSINVSGPLYPNTGALSGTRTYNGVYTASGTITAGENVTIRSGTSVEFYGETVILRPGFKAEAGSKFIAAVQSCEIVCSGGLMKNRDFLDSESIVAIKDTLFSTRKQVKNHIESNNNIEGLDDLSENITLYPNPNTGSFTIQTNNWEGIQQIQVINPLGQVVYTVRNPEINTINLYPGMKGTFFVRITTSTKTVTRKILVE